MGSWSYAISVWCQHLSSQATRQHQRPCYRGSPSPIRLQFAQSLRQRVSSPRWQTCCARTTRSTAKKKRQFAAPSASGISREEVSTIPSAAGATACEIHACQKTAQLTFSRRLKMQNKLIREEFAKNILRTCYAIDARLGELETLCSTPCNEKQLGKLKETFSSLTTMVGADVMVPIYMKHSQLGRIMEPGSWLDHGSERRNFGVQE